LPAEVANVGLDLGNIRNSVESAIVKRRNAYYELAAVGGGLILLPVSG
jgi:hypothetical protein